MLWDKNKSFVDFYSATANLGILESKAADKYIMGTAMSMLAGEQIPNIPEMGKFWNKVGPSLKSITQGEKTATQAFTEAAQFICQQ